MIRKEQILRNEQRITPEKGKGKSKKAIDVLLVRDIWNII